LIISGSAEFENLLRSVSEERGWSVQVARSLDEAAGRRGDRIEIVALGWFPDRGTTTAIGNEITRRRYFRDSVLILFDIHEPAMGKPTAISIGALEYCQLPRSSKDWDGSVRRRAGDTLERILSEHGFYSGLKLHGVFRHNESGDYSFFKNMVESSAIIMFGTDADGRILTMNLAGLTAFGYAPSEVVEREYGFLFAPAVTRESVLDMHEVVMHTEGWEGEFLYRRRNGSTFPGWTAVSRIWGPGGRLEGLVFTVRDITREKELEAQNRDMQGQILHAQKMESIGTLAGGVAHDFNNLLVGILGYSSRIRESLSPTDRHYDGILQIETCAERAARLTQGLLAFSRNTPMDLRSLDVNRIVRETVEILRPSFPATIEIETTLAEDARAVSADPSQLQQVLMNLCINARDAMSQGGKLTITTGNRCVDPAQCHGRTHARPGDHVRLSVFDTGIGIPPEHLERIFEPFFTTKRVGHGTGLGLPVVYGIVRSHGGFIEIDSTPGKGSAFHIHLPAAEGRAEENGETEPASAGGTETVLLVDDEEMIRRLGTDILESVGYRVLTASNGVEALAMLDEEACEVDVVILDLTMPRMSGGECARELRRRSPDLPVIVCSGYNLAAEDGSCEIAGATDFLQKPYRTRQLVAVVRRALDGRLKRTV